MSAYRTQRGFIDESARTPQVKKDYGGRHWPASCYWPSLSAGWLAYSGDARGPWHSTLKVQKIKISIIFLLRKSTENAVKSLNNKILHIMSKKFLARNARSITLEARHSCRRRSLASELSLSCARPAVDG